MVKSSGRATYPHVESTTASDGAEYDDDYLHCFHPCPCRRSAREAGATSDSDRCLASPVETEPEAVNWALEVEHFAAPGPAKNHCETFSTIESLRCANASSAHAEDVAAEEPHACEWLAEAHVLRRPRSVAERPAVV